MRILTIWLMALVLAGCGGAATVPTTDATTVPGTDTTAVTVPTEAPTTAPAATVAPAETTTAEMIGPTEQVMASLVQQLGIESANLQFVSAEEQEWPTPGLGCEQEGMMYTQVITPGYKITFTDGTNTYAVHTDQTGEQAVLCENGKPTALSTAGS